MNYFLATLIVPSIILSAPAYATCSAALGVTVSATAVAFGNYDASSGVDTPANGTITVNCSARNVTTLPSFTLVLSTGSAGSFNPRQMNYLANKLSYNLYTSAVLNTVWGDGTGGTATQSYSTSSNVDIVSFTVYGDIAKHQYIAPGTYTDSLTVTVTY